jgi:hypothetical protein
MPTQRQLASDRWSAGGQLETSDALSMLHRWYAETAKLGFGYFHSLGGRVGLFVDLQPDKDGGIVSHADVRMRKPI